MALARSTDRACVTCNGDGRVPDPAVSRAVLTVAGVRITVRRPCPACAGTATIRVDHHALAGAVEE